MDEQFKILSEGEHALARPSMYIGSTSIEDQTHISFREVRTFSVVPGLIKIIEEIYQNSVDEAIRTNFKFANLIEISIGKDDTGADFIEVKDNGRGIPVTATEEGYRPVLSWTRARAGTSFGENRNTIGANGVGSFLTAVFSNRFIGITSDGKKELTLDAHSNLTKYDVSVKDSKKNGTRVKFYPDMSRFHGVDHLTSDHVDLIKDRITHLAICYPGISFVFNGDKIKVSPKSVGSKYSDTTVSYQDESKTIVFAPLPGKLDGFHSISYVNGIFIKNGGSHISWIVGNVIEEMRPMIKKKWKIEVSPSQISNGLLLVTYLSGFENLRFDSQTKERVTNTQKELSDYFGMKSDDFKKIAKQIIDTPEIIMPIIEAILWKKEQEEKREAARLAKQAKKVQVVNHIEAQSKNPEEKTIFICEGQSAQGPIIAVRDSMRVGSYALRGKVMNTYGMKPTEILKNKEYFELCAVLGLEFGKPIDTLSYHRIAILTDQDPDGDGIATCLLAFFSFWPELFERGHIFRAKSPLYVCRKKNQPTKIFYTTSEYNDAKLDSSWEVNYIKGLGSLDQDDYSDVINKPNLVKIEKITDLDSNKIEMAFGSDSNSRKEWMLG